MGVGKGLPQTGTGVLPIHGMSFQSSAEDGGEQHITTQENTQANRFAETFVKVMVKMVHTDLAEK